jgi:hypothetical protein
MKGILFAALLTLILFPLGTSAQNKVLKTDDLSWFAGCWEASVPEKGMTISEMWTKPDGGTMIGVGRTVVKGKTVSYEFMRMVETNDGIDYIAKPSSNSGETSFRSKSSNGKEIVFENLENDFPKRIIYKSDKADLLFARIEAAKDGKTKAIDFPMIRVKCN